MLNKPHVLIVDDTEDAASALVLWLQQRGWHADYASTADSARDLYQRKLATSHPYDVMLLDLALPRDTGGSGVAFAEWVRETGNDKVGFVFFTGHDNERSRERAKAVNAAGYYVKPQELNILESALLSAMN